MIESEIDTLTHEEAQKVLIERISKAKHVRTIEEYELERKAAKDWLRTLSQRMVS